MGVMAFGRIPSDHSVYEAQSAIKSPAFYQHLPCKFTFSLVDVLPLSRFEKKKTAEQRFHGREMHKGTTILVLLKFES
jgi:hypothetical protein